MTKSGWAAALALLALSACKNDMRQIAALTDPASNKEEKAFGVTFLYSESGHAKAKLYTREFVRNDRALPPYADMKKGLKVEFFDDSLRVQSVLTAGFARYYEKQQNVLIREDVRVNNRKGERLLTTELVWNQKMHKFFTNKAVTIIGPTQTLYGDGMEANQDFSWYEIRNLRGSMQVEKKGVPE